MESKYKHLYNQLQAQIEKREYKAGDKLPSEGDLMELYGASRDTVRKALDLLYRTDLSERRRESLRSFWTRINLTSRCRRSPASRRYTVSPIRSQKRT